RLTDFGERADWSHDGERILFVEKTFGDVYEVHLKTKRLRLLTGHYPHLGYTRALYLANGDILLSGPERFDPRDPGPSRVQCFLSPVCARRGAAGAAGGARDHGPGGAGGPPPGDPPRRAPRRGDAPGGGAGGAAADRRARFL